MSKHTDGPWRWQFNAKHKSMTLVGGKPKYDLTIMDFDRWGTQGAVATLRDPAEDGMNIMYRLCDRPDWIAPFPGRAHHADWCADITHPDMRLIAAAPELLEACSFFLEAMRSSGVSNGMIRRAEERARAAIAKAKGE